MFIRYVCNNCGQKCKSAEEYAGLKVNCSRCTLPLEIPILASAVDVHDTSPELLLAAASHAEQHREKIEQASVQALIPEKLPEPALESNKLPVQQTENKPSEKSTDFNNATSVHAKPDWGRRVLLKIEVQKTLLLHWLKRKTISHLKQEGGDVSMKTRLNKMFPLLLASTAGLACLSVIAFSTVKPTRVLNNDITVAGQKLIIPAPEGYVRVRTDVANYFPPDQDRFLSILLPEVEIYGRTGLPRVEGRMLAIFVPPDVEKLLGDTKYVPTTACTVQVLPGNDTDRTLDEYQEQRGFLEYIYTGRGRAYLGANPKHHGRFIGGSSYAAWLTMTTAMDARLSKEGFSSNYGLVYQSVVTISMHIKGRILFLRMYKGTPAPKFGRPANADELSAQSDAQARALRRHVLADADDYRDETASWIRAIYSANSESIEK